MTQNKIPTETQSNNRSRRLSIYKLDLQKTTTANLEQLLDSRVPYLSIDDVEKDLLLFSKKAMKSIWD